MHKGSFQQFLEGGPSTLRSYYAYIDSVNTVTLLVWRETVLIPGVVWGRASFTRAWDEHIQDNTNSTKISIKKHTESVLSLQQMNCIIPMILAFDDELC